MDFDFDAVLYDRRYDRIRVCLTHGGLYDDRPDSQTGRRQSCHEREDQEQWDGFDFNEWIRLCDCCLTELIRSGSRWSTFFCSYCLDPIRDEELAIPIGRHSMMNGISMPPLDVRDLARSVDSMFDRIDRLQRWKAERVRQIGVRFAADPYLDEFLDLAYAVDASAVGLLVDWWKNDIGWDDRNIATDAKTMTASWKAAEEGRA